MSTLSARMERIRAELAGLFPSRIVTRNLLDFASRSQSDLQAGIYTLVSASEGDYSHYLGGMTRDGEHRIVIVGQTLVSESSAPSAAEDAESDMIDDIKLFSRSLPPDIGSMLLVGWRQSQQMDHPYAWIACDAALRADQ